MTCQHLKALHGAGDAPRIIRLWCTRYWRAARCETCDPTERPQPASDPRWWVREYTCLCCPLDECDESDPRCLYVRSVFSRRGVMRAQNYTEGNECPICHRAIMDSSTTCIEHRGWL